MRAWGRQFDYPGRPLTVPEFEAATEALARGGADTDVMALTHEKLCIFLAPICAEITRNPEALASTMMIGSGMLGEDDRTSGVSVFHRLSMTTGSTGPNANAHDQRGAMAGVPVPVEVARREVALACSVWRQAASNSRSAQMRNAADLRAFVRARLATTAADQLAVQIGSKLGRFLQNTMEA